MNNSKKMNDTLDFISRKIAHAAFANCLCSIPSVIWLYLSVPVVMGWMGV